MFAIVTISKKHQHVYDVEDDGNIISAACLNDENGKCTATIQKLGNAFKGVGQLKVKWTNSPSKRVHDALYH